MNIMFRLGIFCELGSFLQAKFTRLIGLYSLAFSKLTVLLPIKSQIYHILK